MGFSSLEELRSRPSAEIMADYVVEDEHGKRLSIEDIPSIRLMHGEDAPPLLMRTTHRETGERKWQLLKTTPLPADEGGPVAAVTVIEDLTAVKTAEVRMRVLAESGRRLASSLDYQQTLRNVAHVAVPALADWCAVDLVDSRGRREHVVVAHPDSERYRLAEQLRAFEPEQIEPQSVIDRVIRTGIPELFDEISDEQLRSSARSPEHLGLLRALEMRSVILVPLTVGARTIGVMTLVSAESRRRLDHEDVELAAQLGRRAAVAVENARLHTTLAAVADTLQQSLLPEELPEVPGWELASLYRPAQAEQRIDVGGDFYEVFAAGRAWIAVIGDVAGKGVSAAALTALMRHGARFASGTDSRPAQILAQLDAALRSRPGSPLCTALCLRLADQEVQFASAGHPPPLLVSASGAVREVGRPGPLLGAFSDADWPEQTVSIGSDQLLLLYTDGVIDAGGPEGRFGSERLAQLLASCHGCGADEVVARLELELEQFAGSSGRADDVAALALRPRPRP